MNLSEQLILPGAQVVRQYGDRLLKGISPDQFARKPVGPRGTIDMNHPAFVYGHLSLYPAILGEFLGLPKDDLAVPAYYRDLFQKETSCHDDVEGKIYPPMNELVHALNRGMDIVIPALSNLPPELLLSDMPDETRRARFPTIGSFVLYILIAHPNGHFGQVSAWRRCMGLPAA